MNLDLTPGFVCLGARGFLNLVPPALMGVAWMTVLLAIQKTRIVVAGDVDLDSLRFDTKFSAAKQ